MARSKWICRECTHKCKVSTKPIVDDSSLHMMLQNKGCVLNRVDQIVDWQELNVKS